MPCTIDATAPASSRPRLTQDVTGVAGGPCRTYGLGPWRLGDDLDCSPTSASRARSVNGGNGFDFIDHLGNICPSGFLPAPRGKSARAIWQPCTGPMKCSSGFVMPTRCQVNAAGRCQFREICGCSRSRLCRDRSRDGIRSAVRVRPWRCDRTAGGTHLRRRDVPGSRQHTTTSRRSRGRGFSAANRLQAATHHAAGHGVEHSGNVGAFRLA